ncbi:polysaccharide biosynthesis protein [Paenibacillus sp. GSMTC-2017]|uniref:putative polysaccharide biosynthesis protein n=1 Tax=Paenibacillus sp. GSMTC-2017 TaxID=2794350 RepID=UPI0018D857E3|nr:polysaccharide biosynthesis protein [Paenibacillus sp. GSMTC-2017]MBH5319203.1 polysaccharide biosynthesis protein [Paenibacillus sp. GSMTC-2017]
MLKKDSLIKGTLILAAAALVARFLGLFQRIPLDYMLDSEGMAAFVVANQIYLVLLILATAGFPSALSKMVSERYALGKPEEAKRIYHAALIFGAVTGLILASSMFIMAPFFADFVVNQPNADLAIRAIAPALLLFPIIAMMRGYFMGRQMMSAGGTSQIVEQFLRVIVGIGLGMLVLSLGWGTRWGAAAITFGSFIGSIGALSIMLVFARKLKRQDAEMNERFNGEASTAIMSPKGTDRSPSTIKFRTIYKEILKMSLPSLVTSMAINFIYFFDLALFMRLTEAYYPYAIATDVMSDFGGKAQSLAGIPPILAIALGSSIIPIIATAYSIKNFGEVQRQASVVLRIVCFTGVPIALLLTIASYSITGLLFESTSGYEAVAMLCAGTILQITMMTSNSILYGMGKQKVSMRHTLIGLFLKVVVSIALAPFLGVFGLIIGSTICFIVVTMLNLRWINKEVKLHVLGKRWVSYIIAVAIAALGGWGAEVGVLALTGNWHAKLSFFAAATIAAIVVGVMYVSMLILLRVVTPEDVNSFPGALRKPFKKLMRVFHRGVA